MNILQLHYFITAAQTLNFSKAAEKLYISQPALSKQISAIEKELDIKLFIRSANSLKLTPAAGVLLQRFPAFLEEYYAILSEATKAQTGHTGVLTVGTLQSQRLSEESAGAFRRFSEQHPQFAIKLIYDGFQGLRDRLDSRDIDIAVSLGFDLGEGADICVERLETCKALIVLSRSFAVCQKPSIAFHDLADIPFIIPEDSFSGSRMILEECQRHGFTPRLRYAANLSTVMLLVEAGMGTAFVNEQSTIIDNKRIRVLHEIPLGDDTVVCCGWKKSNENPAVPLFLECLLPDGFSV